MHLKREKTLVQWSGCTSKVPPPTNETASLRAQTALRGVVALCYQQHHHLPQLHALKL